jgi:hypothetical protein
MPSADQVPVNSTHSTMRWHKWVVLIVSDIRIEELFHGRSHDEGATRGPQLRPLLQVKPNTDYQRGG